MARKPADQTVSREDVLFAAARVFRLRGYHGATMQLIADELGLRQSSLYHYFPSKRALLLTLVNEGVERLTLFVSRATPPSLSPDARLAAAIRAYLCAIAAHPDVALVTILEARALLDTPAERQEYTRKRDEMEKLFASIIDDGIREGLFRPVDVSIVTKILFSVHNWFVIWYRPEGRLSADAIGQIVSDLFLAGLRAGAWGMLEDDLSVVPAWSFVFPGLSAPILNLQSEGDNL